MIGTGPTGEGVVAIAADQEVGTAVADQRVIEGIASCIDVVRTRQGNVFNTVAGDVTNRASN